MPVEERNKLLHVASILYIQAKLLVKINLNYLQLSKNLYVKKLSPNEHNCLLLPIFWRFCTEVCDLLLSKPRELPTGTFFQSRNSGESVPCRDKWSKRTWRILAEYYLRIEYIGPLGSGTTLGLPSFHFSGLALSLVPAAATNRVRAVAGILFRMASQQTATIATSCSIWPHEILAFTTSTFPSFYSSYILAHFQVFTVQSRVTQLTTLCADERGYMSNTSSLLFSLPVIFVLIGRGGGGGADVLVGYFWRVKH